MRRRDRLIMVFVVLLAIQLANKFGYLGLVYDWWHADEKVHVSIESISNVLVDYNMFDNFGWNWRDENDLGGIDYYDEPSSLSKFHKEYQPNIHPIDICLLRFSRPVMDINDVRKELQSRGLRPLTGVELFGLAKARMDLFEQGYVVALGELCRGGTIDGATGYRVRGFLTMYKSVHTPYPDETYRRGYRYGITVWPYLFTEQCLVAATPDSN